MYWSGIIIGAISFLVIGVFHPIVIKCEYYFTHRIWPLFLVAGLGFCGASLFVGESLLSPTFAIIGFAMLWSIHELNHQTERVKKGWFPENPRRVSKEAVKGNIVKEL